MSRSKMDWPSTGAELWRELYEGLRAIADLFRQLLRKLVDGIRGTLGMCDHGFTMKGDGIITSRDLDVVMLSSIQGFHSRRLKYQIRCRCCKKIVAHRNFEQFEILGV